MNKNKIKKEENANIEIIKETIIYEKIEETNDVNNNKNNNDIQTGQNKKKKSFKQFEDN